MADSWRQEYDPLGKVLVPDRAYWGAQTQRAVENFPISGLKPHPILLDALVLIKIAGAQANLELDGLTPEKVRPVIQAGQEILAGLWREHFVVDVFQAGAGTSLHMNINEVLANRAGELAGEPRGTYNLIHPNDHVNFGQSTNDVFPTAMRLAILMELRTLYPEGEALVEALRAKAQEFEAIYKAGRTHLNDALPVTLGNEFQAYGEAVATDLARIRQGAEELLFLGIGGTAVGSGVNALPGYQELVIEKLRRLTGLDLQPRPDLFEAMQNLNPFGQTGGTSQAPGAHPHPGGQRSSVAGFRSQNRSGRTRATGGAAGIIHHERQDQPIDLRSPQHDLLSCHRAGNGGGFRGAGRAAGT